MPVTIQDDFWEAAKQMSARNGADFLYAIIAYGMDGAEPTKKAAWLPTFTVVKDRVRMSEEAKNRGKAMAEARWGKRNSEDAQASPKHMHKQCSSNAQASDKHDAQAYAQASPKHMHKHDAKEEYEYEEEIPPTKSVGGSPLPPDDAQASTKHAQAGVFEPPSIDAVIEQGKALGMPEESCRKFFDHYAGQGWVTGSGVQIRDWAAKLRSWAADDRNRRLTELSKAKGGGEGAAGGAYVRDDEVDRYVDL